MHVCAHECLLFVVEHEAEDAVEAVAHGLGRGALLVHVQDHLTVRVREDLARVLELLADVQVVVDLAVDGQGARLRGTGADRR